MSNVSELEKAFLLSTVTEETTIAVKAEDVQQNNGIDFSKHFFEPKVGASYVIKFLPNPGGEPITHRSLYKDLPDPDRKGKTFHYISSGNAKTCQALELFFELNNLKKAGDIVAEKKIEKYMGKTNQGCCKIQILQSPDANEIGIIRMFQFATFGPNATVANLIDGAINPSAEKIKAGETKEDIFNIFNSSVMMLECVESLYPGKNGAPSIKGRDFSKSSWIKKKRGAIAKLEIDGQIKTREFKESDLNNGLIDGEALPYFKAFVKEVVNPDYDIFNFFAYKDENDPRLTKETKDYVVAVNKKVAEIIPVIREKSLEEIANYGKGNATDSAPKADKATNVMADSIPDELADSIMAGDSEKKTAPKADTAPKDEMTQKAEDILNS
jgi:hypothetical protein